ncbi:hypothetical protein [Mesorhizobium delmotii]|uniref:Crp/Fnr family transcriptional regulator n=1 Tax=Mesorhizobium delmotii TaxID=1631247 RepID=A0A2P9AD33_9HYPH|nr:hypothetical protein BQ8482_110956 [Mesorhizobium delmotii]
MPQSLPRNHVLKALSPEDFALLRPSMHRVQLNLKAQLELPYQPIEHVYFPEAGIASVVATMTGGRQSEVGIVGYDGMTGVAVILGTVLPMRPISKSQAMVGACRLKIFVL